MCPLNFLHFASVFQDILLSHACFTWRDNPEKTQLFCVYFLWHFFACFKYPITIPLPPSLPPLPPLLVSYYSSSYCLTQLHFHGIPLYVCSKPLFLRTRYLRVLHSNCNDVFIHYALDLKGCFCLCQRKMNQIYIFIRSNSWFAVLCAWCK